jgi:hypothetical protein
MGSEVQYQHLQCNLLPHLDLTGQVRKADRFPFAQGGMVDLYRGVWKKNGCENNIEVRVYIQPGLLRKKPQPPFSR